MPSGSIYILDGIKDSNPGIRITALRAARAIHKDVIETITALAHDTDPQVLKECAIALHHNKAPEATKLWTTLALNYKSGDRWLLEALGIGADGQWNQFLNAYLQENKEPLLSAAGHDLIWRSRNDEALPSLAALAMDSTTALKAGLRYFRAFDFHPGKNKTLLKCCQVPTNPTQI